MSATQSRAYPAPRQSVRSITERLTQPKRLDRRSISARELLAALGWDDELEPELSLERMPSVVARW